MVDVAGLATSQTSSAIEATATAGTMRVRMSASMGLKTYI